MSIASQFHHRAVSSLGNSKGAAQCGLSVVVWVSVASQFAACSSGKQSPESTSSVSTTSGGATSATLDTAAGVPPAGSSVSETRTGLTQPVTTTPVSMMSGQSSGAQSEGDTGAEASGTSTEPDTRSSGAPSSEPVETSAPGTSSATPEAPKQSWVFTASTDGRIRMFTLDAATGTLTEEGEASLGSSGGDVFIAMAPGSSRLFAVFNRGITAFDFDPVTAKLTERASGTTAGAGTYAGVAADAEGEHVYVAHYNENALSYLKFDGSAFSAPQSFSAGQKVHSAQESATGGWVLVPCLGSNYVAQYRRSGDALAPATNAQVAVDGGPRHFAFHPGGTFVYVLTELTAELRAFAFSEANGLGTVLDTETIGVQAQGKYWGSDVKISPDGKDVFAVERNAKQVFHFDVQADGTLEPSGVSVDLGGVVRVFDRTTDGKYLFLGNDRGELVTLGFDSATNQLTAVAGSPTGLGTIYTTMVRDF